jgi:hypothetical protein
VERKYEAVRMNNKEIEYKRRLKECEKKRKEQVVAMQVCD